MATDHTALGNHDAARTALHNVLTILVRLNSPEAAAVRCELAALESGPPN